MRAVVVEGGNAYVREAPTPQPSKGEVLVRVRMAGICGTDLEILKGYAGFNGILGHEFVGTVVDGPARLAGKRVVGEINCVCGQCDMCQGGLSNHCRNRTVVGIVGRSGAFAEFIALPERNCHVVPESVSDAAAVFTEPLAAAMQVNRQVKIEPRMNVAVVGTGRLGLLVAQVVAALPCKLVAIGRNPLTLGLLDRWRIQTATPSGLEQRAGEFDVVIDCTGSPEGLPLAFTLVRPKGIVVMKTTCSSPAEGGPKHNTDLSSLVVNEVTMIGSRCGPFSDALAALARKQIDVPGMVTRTMALEETPAALKLATEPDQIKVLLKVGE